MPVPNVYLRVNRRLLLLPNLPTANQPNPQPSQPPPGTTGNLNIIAAELPDLQKFAGDTVDWLLSVARLLLDPKGVGVLHTFQTGTVSLWLDREMDGSWRQVNAGETLVPTIYEYRRLDGQAMEPTRICDYHDKAKSESMKSQTTRGREKEFCKALLVRDLQCIVSQLSPLRMLSAARLIPRCLGDIGVRYIFQRFTGLSTPVTTYHQSMGVTVNLLVADLIDTFELGFWDMGNNQYEVHHFEDDEELNLAGLPRMENDPKLHRYVVTVGPDPPSGVYGWQYIQCVLRRFATKEYVDLNNIIHFAQNDDEPEAGEIDSDNSDPEDWL